MWLVYKSTVPCTQVSDNKLCFRLHYFSASAARGTELEIAADMQSLQAIRLLCSIASALCKQDHVISCVACGLVSLDLPSLVSLDDRIRYRYDKQRCVEYHCAELTQRKPLVCLHDTDATPTLQDLQYMSYTSEDGSDVPFRLMDRIKPRVTDLAIGLGFPQHIIANLKTELNPVTRLKSTPHSPAPHSL